MRKSISELPAYAIVVEGNEASEYYFSKIKPVWKSVGVDVRPFYATTPDTLPDSPLVFGKNCAVKYTGLDPTGKEFTPTEKAVWYSHYRLWWKSAFENKQLLVIEHDCAPFDPSKLWYESEDHYKSFDIGALGCYMMQPSFAKMVLNHLQTDTIKAGPLGYLNRLTRQENKRTPDKWKFIDSMHDQWDPGCTQIIHKKFGTTIDHYKGTIAEGVEGIDMPWAHYVVIDNLPNRLTVDVMNQNKKLPSKFRRQQETKLKSIK